MLILAVPHGRGPSIEQLFVAQTQAASDADATCTMPARLPAPEARTRPAAPGHPDSRATPSADLAPVRMVVDPYPSFNGVVVDHDQRPGDDERHQPQEPAALRADRRQPDVERSRRSRVQQIMGPDTGIGFVAGVAMDPAHRELFTVNNDVEDRMVVFDYDAAATSSRSGCSTCRTSRGASRSTTKRDEIALSVQTPNMFVVFKRDAQKFDAPIRSVRGPKTGMADPHGIYFDETHNEVVRRQPRQLPSRRADHVLHRLRRARVAAGAHRQRVQRERARPLRPLVADRLRRRRERRRRAAADDLGAAQPDRLADGRRRGRGEQRDLRRQQRRQLDPGLPADGQRQRAAQARDPRTARPASRGRWASPSRRTRSGSRTSATTRALVFPRLAAGNVAPRRIVRNAPAGKETSGFGNPVRRRLRHQAEAKSSSPIESASRALRHLPGWQTETSHRRGSFRDS